MPIRDRWTGWTAVTIADRRLPDRRELADLAAGVHAHLEDRGLVLGAEPSTVSGRPTSLFWFPSVRSVAKRALEDARDSLLGRGLRDAPGDPDDERREPPAPGGRDGVEAAQRVGDEDDGDVAEVRIGVAGRRHAVDEQGGCARGDGVGEEAMAVGPLARQGDEQAARA